MSDIILDECIDKRRDCQHSMKILDLTDLKIATEWKYRGLLDNNYSKFAEGALAQGYNTIKYGSVQDFSDTNYAILKDFGKILRQTMVMPMK